MDSFEEFELSGGSPTIGKMKMTRHLHDLLQNEDFVKELDEFYNLDSEDETFGTNKAYECIQRLSLKYKLPIDLISRLTVDRELNLKSIVAPNIDVCVLNVPAGDLRNRDYKKNMSLEERANAYTYPVNISVSAHASKKEIFDFINKSWKDIKYWQNEVNKEPIRTRVRPKEERNNFIWQQRKQGLSIRSIARAARKQFNDPAIDEKSAESALRRMNRRHRVSLSDTT